MKLQIKMKILIATAIAILLVATACSGGGDLSVTTNQVGFPAGPTTTTESDGSSNLVEVSSEPAPTTEPTAATEASVTTESTTTTLAPAVEAIVNPHPDWGPLSKYGTFTVKSDGELDYKIDTADLPPFTNFKIVDGEKYFYVKEVDDYIPCWETAGGEWGQEDENGYCSHAYGAERFFVESDGRQNLEGYLTPGLIEDRKQFEREKGEKRRTPFYVPIPDELPSRTVSVIVRTYEEELLSTDSHGSTYSVTRSDVLDENGNPVIDTLPCTEVGKHYDPDTYEKYLRTGEKNVLGIFWIHEDGICKNGQGHFVHEENGTFGDEYYEDGKITQFIKGPIGETVKLRECPICHKTAT